MRSAILYSLAAAAYILSACTPSLSTDEERVPVRISLSPPETRAADYGVDGSVQRATVYVMEPSVSDSSVPGNVVDIASFPSGAAEYELVTSMGPKFFFMVLNGPAAGSPATYSAAKALTFNMDVSGGNSLSRSAAPLMTGLSEKTTVTTDMQSIPISVSRRVFRVNIAAITNSLPQHSSLTILYAYLSNYVKNYSLGNGNASPISYGNPRGRNGGGVINGTSVFSENGYAAIPRSMSIGSSEVGTDYDGVGMYAFPNPCTADTWSTTSTAARKTRIVLVASISGNICYYPVTLEPQTPNCAYNLDITICNPGTSDPESELPKGAMEMDMTVTDWSTIQRQTNL